MKKLIILLFIGVMAVWTFVSCEDEPKPEPEPEPEEKIEWKRAELEVLRLIYEKLNPTSPDYPSPWDIEDESTWKDIRIDTVFDEIRGKKVRVIGAMTIYLKEGEYMPTNLVSFDYMKKLEIRASSGAYFVPWFIPVYLDTLIVDKIDPSDKGLIRINNGNFQIDADFSIRTFKKKLEIHDTEMDKIKWKYYYFSEVDLSGNCLTGSVDEQYFWFRTPVDLSNNKFTSVNMSIECWDNCLSVPNLQNNNITIPEEWLKTEAWKKHHEKFKGNPGYRPPVD